MANSILKRTRSEDQARSVSRLRQDLRFFTDLQLTRIETAPRLGPYLRRTVRTQTTRLDRLLLIREDYSIKLAITEEEYRANKYDLLSSRSCVLGFYCTLSKLQN